MQEITIGQIGTALAFLVAFFTGFAYLSKQMKTWLVSALKDQFKPINDKMSELSTQICEVDMESTKNYLVASLSSMEKGLDMDEIERERFWEQYQHYQKIGGNTYIKKKVEQLEKEGKL